MNKLHKLLLDRSNSLQNSQYNTSRFFHIVNIIDSTYFITNYTIKIEWDFLFSCEFTIEEYKIFILNKVNEYRLKKGFNNNIYSIDKCRFKLINSFNDKDSFQLDRIISINSDIMFHYQLSIEIYNTQFDYNKFKEVNLNKIISEFNSIIYSDNN